MVTLKMCDMCGEEIEGCNKDIDKLKRDRIKKLLPILNKLAMLNNLEK